MIALFYDQNGRQFEAITGFRSIHKKQHTPPSIWLHGMVINFFRDVDWLSVDEVFYLTQRNLGKSLFTTAGRTETFLYSTRSLVLEAFGHLASTNNYPDGTMRGNVGTVT